MIKWTLLVFLGCICLQQYQKSPIVVSAYVILAVMMNGLSFVASRKRKKVNKSVLYSRNVQLIAICLTFVFISMNCDFLLPETTAETPKARMSNYIDTLINIKEERWDALSEEERMEVLQCVADCEAYDLGIPTRLTVTAVDIADKGIAGRYRDAYRQIKIDRGIIMSSEVKYALSVICHEVYHAYEYRLIELYENTDEEMKRLKIFQNAVTYKKEFDNYVSCSEDTVAYNMQRCEQDADLYAEMTVKKYYDYVGKYAKER